MRQLQCWAMVAALLILASCSKDKEIDKPAELTSFSATLKVERVWSASIGDKGAKPLRLGLGLATEGNRVYAAGHSGDVIAFDLATGHSVWRTRTKAHISGGPGVGGDLVAVGTSEGEIIALNSADGKIRWRVRLNGEVLSAPAISERVIAVRTVDGKLRGLAPNDGHELWVQEQQVPRLSLRGTSRPVIVGDLALCGFDNGKVIAVNMKDGTLQWESTIAPPHGRTELERLVDVDSAVKVSGQDVYTVGFQGRVAMLALETGQIWWSHDASSYRGIGLDDDALYVASADGDVVALRRRTGAEIWRQKALAHRGLSAAVTTDNAVVVADYQGNVHWLDKATGELAARTQSGKVRVSNPPLVAGNLVLVMNDAGHISAFRTTPIGSSMSGVRKVPAEDKPAASGPAAPAPAAPDAAAPAAPPAAAAPDAVAPAPTAPAAPDATAPAQPDTTAQPDTAAPAPALPTAPPAAATPEPAPPAQTAPRPDSTPPIAPR